MPSASVMMAIVANPGLLISVRRPYRKSSSNLIISVRRGWLSGSLLPFPSTPAECHASARASNTRVPGPAVLNDALLAAVREFGGHHHAVDIFHALVAELRLQPQAHWSPVSHAQIAAIHPV